MRIISGNSKGRRIQEPKDLNTRPLKDLTKESIFNILTHSNKLTIKLENSNVLDLFSGVGSFGLECLSRESSNVTFVENYKNVLPVLKKNILDLNYQKNSLIIEKDIFNNFSLKNLKKKFDIIFMDPPYKEKKVSSILEIFLSCCNETLSETIIEWNNKKSLCIVLCSKGYPEEFKKNVLIKNLDKIKFNENEYYYHAGTKVIKEQIYATGGRVFNFVCLSSNFLKARIKIINLINSLNWDGGFYRKDIGYKVIDE